MDIYVYSDESGVFDRDHNQYFVFGGVLFLSKEKRDICARKYTKAEKDILESLESPCKELKAHDISNKNKGKLFRSINQELRFGVVIDQQSLDPLIFTAKKHKQRYLDYAFKIMIRRYLEKLIALGYIAKDEVHKINFFVDEHSTATDGRYELRESLQQEFFYGTFNMNWNKFFPPIFSQRGTVNLVFCNSEKKTLIRSADIIANRILYKANTNPTYSSENDHFYVIRLP